MDSAGFNGDTVAIAATGAAVRRAAAGLGPAALVAALRVEEVFPAAASPAVAAVSAAAVPEENGNMKTFQEAYDSTRIESAIAHAEKKTSGEIRVVIHRAPT